MSLPLISSNVHVELSNLVGVLARGWHLDCTGPIVVEVTQSIGQVLQVHLRQGRVVAWHVEVGREDATLGSLAWNEVEIEG